MTSQGSRPYHPEFFQNSSTTHRFESLFVVASSEFFQNIHYYRYGHGAQGTWKEFESRFSSLPLQFLVVYPIDPCTAFRVPIHDG